MARCSFKEAGKYILFWAPLCLPKVLGSFTKEKKENGYWGVSQQCLLQWHFVIVTKQG